MLRNINKQKYRTMGTNLVRFETRKLPQNLLLKINKVNTELVTKSLVFLETSKTLSVKILKYARIVEFLIVLASYTGVLYIYELKC